jgi:hypothetical protein
LNEKQWWEARIRLKVVGKPETNEWKVRERASVHASRTKLMHTLLKGPIMGSFEAPIARFRASIAQPLSRSSIAGIMLDFDGFIC